MSDSYAATRIHVMRTKLIQPDEYERLLKMSDKEIVNFLQSTEYKEDVTALSIHDLEDLEVVDKILSHNQRRTLEKLGKISRGKFTNVLNEVLRRNDVRNVMTIAEALAGKKDPAEALRQYGTIGTIDMTPFLAVQNFRELADLTSKQFGIDETAQNFLEFKEMIANVSPVENVHLRTDAYLIDEHNIIDIIRFKREDIPTDKLRLQPGGTIKESALKAAANAADVKSALTMLRGTAYADVIERALSHLEEGNMVRFEADLHKTVISRIRKLTRRYPLGVELLIHYLAEKNTEYENLRLLIKGKRLGLEDSFMKSYLIT